MTTPMRIDWDGPIEMDDGLALRAMFGGGVSIHTEPGAPSRLLVPVIP